MDAYRRTIERILKYEPDAVVVGGYALEFWASRYGLNIQADYQDAITRDLDYLGSREAAKALGEAIAFTFDVKVNLVDWDDVATPNTGVLVVGVEGERAPLTVDFLAFLQGIDAQHVRSRAIQVGVTLSDGVQAKVVFMHPLDVAISRVANLVHLPQKQDSKGYAQAALARDMLRCWFGKVVQDGQLAMLEAAANELLRFAKTSDGIAGALVHGIDYLPCVPRASLTETAQVQWDRECLAIEAARDRRR